MEPSYTTSTEPKAWAHDGTRKGWKRFASDVAMEAYWMMFCMDSLVDIVVFYLPQKSNEQQDIKIEQDDRLQNNYLERHNNGENGTCHNQCPPIDASRACSSFSRSIFDRE